MEALRLAHHPHVEPLVRPRGESQRARLLVAAFDVAGERGIQRTAVSDIVKAAGVSRGTFYELFASKEDCFIEAYRCSTDLLLQVVTDANREAEGDWQKSLRAGIRAFLCCLAVSPKFARAGLLEIQNAGDRGHAERTAIVARYAAAYRWVFEQGVRSDPSLRVPSDEALFVLAAGGEQMVSGYVRDGRVDELPALEDLLAMTAEALFRGVSGQGGAEDGAHLPRATDAAGAPTRTPRPRAATGRARAGSAAAPERG